ncbi:metal-dependent hydrolase [Actinopolymorpha alba]|uniref:metal-dependent hydrolase n=1 Tax=Actinopolymorpha alba TaxID=533267 RepID=UPI000382C9B4|nr:metal-dependent hydrolase [Actinopolymorpha alba]
MLALGHTLSGAAAGLATLPVLEGRSVGEKAAWVAVWAGCALLPDLDAQGTKVTRMWGPLTGGVHVKFWRGGRRHRIVPGITDIVGTVAGGHRRGTHSVLGLLAVLVLVWVASWSRVGTGIVLAVCIGLGLAAAAVVLPGRQPQDYWPVNLGVSVLGAAVLVERGTTLPGWLAFAMAGGAAVHILGDMITVQGCPLGWPTGTHRVSLLPLRADGFVCRCVITPLLGVWCFVIAADLAGYDPLGAFFTALFSAWRI